MDEIVIEPVGGIVGGAGAHLRMRGRVALSALSPEDQKQVTALFAHRGTVDANLRYRLSRTGPNGAEQVEAPADAVPRALLDSIETAIE